jgi:adenylate/nucleoside-diphosphate kinase
MKRIEKYVECRKSLFERVYKLKYKTAQKLIDAGYKYLGGFGRWCPVKLYEGEKMPPLYDDAHKPFPIIYRNYIYFLSSKLAREKFLRNPIKYLKQKPPQPVTPLKISIVGPPKSGKTILANRYCKEFGCLRLSIGEAIRLVLEKQSKTDLAVKIKDHLMKGKTVPDELSIRCIEVAILDVKCQSRGYVLDGFPTTKQQVKYLTDRGLIPVKIIELKCDVKEMLQRGTKDKEAAVAKSMILHSSSEILAYKYKEWKAEVAPIRSWYSNEHRNWDIIDGTLSKWKIWNAAKSLTDKALHQIQSYLTRINQGKAASIANLCVTYEEMLNRLGDFGQYCPVSLALNDELVDCSANRSMDFVAEYQGHYYKMLSQKEVDEFIATPYKYIPPFATRKLPIPDLLPKKRTAAEIKEMMKPIELLGYCPVTYLDGKQRYEAIERGNQEFAVEYKNKIYTMVNEDAREKFLRKPELYSAQKLPHKLPPLKEPMNILNLPMLGYLEQSTAEILIKALHGVGTFKPKFPFVSSTRSALLYIAYYLKG